MNKKKYQKPELETYLLMQHASLLQSVSEQGGTGGTLSRKNGSSWDNEE